MSHSVMRDCIDSTALLDALQNAGVCCNGGPLTPEHSNQVVAVLAKAEASSDGLVRGMRHTMLDDSDIQVGGTTSQVRSCLGHCCEATACPVFGAASQPYRKLL